jgi:hypothetical protein
MNFFFGFTIAVGVFIVIDQHNNYDAAMTLVLALAAAIPYLFWAFYVQSLFPNSSATLSDTTFLIRGVTLLSYPAILFTIAFAVILEWSEE